MAPTPTYICCQCREGPLIQPQCPCSHRPCDNCTYVKGDGSSASQDNASSRPVLPLQSSDQSANINPHYLRSSKAFRSISSQLRNVIPVSAFGSLPQAGTSSYSYIVIFSLPSNFQEFAGLQVPNFRDVANLLVLSGTMEMSYAITCHDYVNQFWGTEGWQFVLHLVEACRSTDIKHYMDTATRRWGVRYKAYCTTANGYPQMKVAISGDEAVVTEFAALLSWVTVFFQQASEESMATAARLECSHAIIIPTTTRGLDDHWIISIMKSSSENWRRPASCEVRRMNEPLSCSQVRGKCWFPLFPNCVLVDSFPVPKRGREAGVEIQFDVMVTLARVSYFLELSPSGRVLKGHSTMLIPTPGTTDDTIQWHFIQSDSPDLYLSTDCIPSDLDILDLDIDELRKRRSFVGYCSRAQIIAGTKESCYESVRQSQAGRGHQFVQIGREISSTMGTGGMGIFGAGLAAKIILTKGLFAAVQAEEGRVEDRILNSNDSPALLYDVGKKTGFIVPELNVCLRILHVWASRQADKHEILSKIPFISEATAGSEMALQEVLSFKELLLREGYADEKPLYFMSKLKEIFLALEQRKEQRRISDESSIRIGAACLRGWELVDIAACRPSWEKGIRLSFGRLGVHPADSCCKIIRDNPDMIVLFSEGMADAIKPFQERVCRAWDPLPRDQYFVLASLKCLKTLSRRNGGTKNQLKLTKKLFMCRPTAINTFEACRKGQTTECSHVYSMSKSPDEALCLDEDGAVILGDPRLSQKITGGDGPQVTSCCLDES